MKKIEIIIPDRELHTVSEIFKDNNIGGMNHYRIEGKGKTKAEPVSIGRVLCNIHQNLFLEQKSNLW